MWKCSGTSLYFNDPRYCFTNQVVSSLVISDSVIRLPSGLWNTITQDCPTRQKKYFNGSHGSSLVGLFRLQT